MSDSPNHPVPLRFDGELRAHLDRNLSGHKSLHVDDNALRRAAVSIVVTRSDRDPNANAIEWRMDQQEEAAVIVTRRAAGMKKHAGQWALPGGRLDDGESAMEAALRELEEEVGTDAGI